MLLATVLALALAGVLALIASAGVRGTSAPRCVGAAARDDKRPCINPSRTFAPTLEQADLVTSSPCRPLAEQPSPLCTSGVSKARAKRHVALVGDSHALQWRSALDFVTLSQRWQAFSIVAPGCPFSDAVKFMPEGSREPCTTWYRAAQAWFRRHPEVSTVFVSSYAPLPLAVPNGKTELGIKVAGLRRAWSSLPRSVKHVVVIRDTPLTTPGTADCLRGALAVGAAPPGEACQVPRALALPAEDPAVTAVKRLRSKRYVFADLTKFFCSDTSCFPVVGGTLVYRDRHGHITLDFSRSLGPYLLRRLRFLMTGWEPDRPAPARSLP